MRPSEFFQRCYAACPQGHMVNLCSLSRDGGKRPRLAYHGSVEVHDLVRLDKFAGESVESNLYFSVCTVDAAPMPGRRGSAEDARGVPVFWADIDVAGKPGAKKDYPTADEALSALRQMPAAPDIVLSTGGGFHAYWILPEVLDARLELTRNRIRAWEGKIRWLLKGKALDSVSDVARILRLPGSRNWNHGGYLIHAIDLGNPGGGGFVGKDIGGAPTV